VKVELREAHPDHIPVLVAHARPADVAEMAAQGLTFEHALQHSLALSTWSITGFADDKPVCMFGVAPGSVLTGTGVPWMLGTTTLDDASVRFIREFMPRCRVAVQAMRETYPNLVNLVDERNTRAVHWLRRLGFRFDPQSFELGGTRFRVFRAGEPHV
jgi:hypothetical protein